MPARFLLLRRLTLSLLLLLTTALHAAPPAPQYHIELEANLAAPFPFLSKFGAVDIHVYPNGVSADSIWLDGFSKNGTKFVTVMNPLGRVYTDVPIAEIAPMLAKLSGSGEERSAFGSISGTMKGTVKGVEATRYRIQYGPEAWIDVWTATSLPASPQFRSIAVEFVRGVAPGTATIMNRLPGLPVYVELNFRRFRKVPILRLKSVTQSSEGEADALAVGRVYYKAPFIDSLWK